MTVCPRRQLDAALTGDGKGAEALTGCQYRVPDGSGPARLRAIKKPPGQNGQAAHPKEVPNNARLMSSHRPALLTAYTISYVLCDLP